MGTTEALAAQTPTAKHIDIATAKNVLSQALLLLPQQLLLLPPHPVTLLQGSAPHRRQARHKQAPRSPSQPLLLLLLQQLVMATRVARQAEALNSLQRGPVGALVSPPRLLAGLQQQQRQQVPPCRCLMVSPLMSWMGL